MMHLYREGCEMHNSASMRIALIGFPEVMCTHGTLGRLQKACGIGFGMGPRRTNRGEDRVIDSGAGNATLD